MNIEKKTDVLIQTIFDIEDNEQKQCFHFFYKSGHCEFDL